MNLLEDTDLRRGNRSEAVHGFESYIYSGTCAIRHLSFPTRIPGPKIFLLHSLLKKP